MDYKVQIDDLVRDATDEEATLLDATQADGAAQAAIEADKKAARQAVLDKLGLSADEAQALLG